jgi:Sulfotransferase family
MRRAAAFILSDVRSGSTLLDQCLGAHPDVVSLGEVHWLRAYVLRDRRLYDPDHPLVCSCGKAVADCEFWRSVKEGVGRPLEQLRLRQTFRPRSTHPGLSSKFARLPRRLVRTNPALFRFAMVQRLFGGTELARDCTALFDAVSDVTGRACCVDSSKSPFRFRPVYDLDPARTFAIVLVRDYRAVVRSKMKRNQTLEAAALGWRRRMIQIDTLTRDLPANRVHRMNYESLCERPADELERVCRFLGLDFVSAMLKRPTCDLHHIGGSPSKFDPSKAEISLDRSYEGSFDAGAAGKLRRLVGDVADRWGY